MANRKTSLGHLGYPPVRPQSGFGGNRRKMNQASGDYAASVSEFDEAGLTRAPAEAVQVARIGESPVNFECRLIRAIRVAEHIVFLGRVIRLHVRDDVLNEGLVDV